MKKNILLLFFGLNFILFAQFSQPKISTLQPVFDFGDIQEGSTVTHNFEIYNKGGDLLKIEKVKASCGCTAAIPTKTELGPNESTKIEVKFNSARRVGKQKKYVYIFSNDPETPQLRLEFTANVLSALEKAKSDQPSIKLSKYNHNFGNIKEGQIYDAIVKVTNSGSGNLEIKNIKSSCGCTAVLMDDKILSPNETSELKVEFNSKNLSGQITRTITLFSNDPKNPTSLLTLIANIEGNK